MKPVTETRDERPALNLVRRTLNYLRRKPRVSALRLGRPLLSLDDLGYREYLAITR